MNSNYFYEYVNLLERVFSYAHQNLYSYGMVEKKIAYCDFFQKIERYTDGFAPIIEEVALIKNIFDEDNPNITDIPSFKECMWAAESYLHIQQETRLTFEAIFLYMPIKKMYEYYPLFHEMDFSQIVDEFNNLYKNESVFSLLISRFNYSLKDIAQKANISYESLFSYKQRRRDIQKISADSACVLASLLKTRIETLIELKL